MVFCKCIINSWQNKNYSWKLRKKSLHCWDLTRNILTSDNHNKSPSVRVMTADSLLSQNSKWLFSIFISVSCRSEKKCAPDISYPLVESIYFITMLYGCQNQKKKYDRCSIFDTKSFILKLCKNMESHYITHCDTTTLDVKMWKPCFSIATRVLF